MDEDLEQRMAELVGGLTPEQYEKLGPALRELTQGAQPFPTRLKFFGYGTGAAVVRRTVSHVLLKSSVAPPLRSTTQTSSVPRPPLTKSLVSLSTTLIQSPSPSLPRATSLPVPPCT